MTSERSRAVMILPMYIVGNGPSDRNELSAGSDWQKPPGWHDHVKKGAQGSTGLANKNSGFTIEANKAIHARCTEQNATVV
jgi:hypothetical protein